MEHNKYKNGKIYKICSPNTDKIYIGSTINKSLNKRFLDHKCSNRNKRSELSWIIIEAGDSYIELIENYPCQCKIELRKREGYYQKLFKDKIVNKQIAGRTYKEYYKDNRDIIIEKRKIWYKNNKEHRQKYYKKYREINKAELKKQKEIYYENKKDYFIKKSADHYKNNKDNILKLFQ